MKRMTLTANRPLLQYKEKGGVYVKKRSKESKDLTREALARGKKIRIFKDNMTWMILAFGGMLFTLIFKYWPMYGIVIAFKDYVPRKGIWGSEWVGFKNFEYFFQSQDATRTIRNTVMYGFGFLIVEIIVGVLIALMLYHLRSKKALNFYQTSIMLPRFLSIVIVSYMTYAILSPSYGVLNQVITALGGDPVAWYNESKWWPAILTIVHIWMIAGSGSLYYYGALVGIDTDLFEAAELDGANTLQKCWHIAIPHLIPVITTLLILGIGRVFSVDMGLFFNIPMDQGALYETTDIIGTYTYRAMLSGSMERSAAVSLAQSVVGLIMVLMTNGVIRKIDPDNAMF